MSKKKLALIVISAVILLTIIVIILSNSSNYDSEIDEYVTSLGFIKDDSGLYNKKISTQDIRAFYNNEMNDGANYEGLSFDMGTHELIKNDFKNIDGARLYFVGTYKYSTNIIKYNYRLVYESTSAIYNGEYDRAKKKFTCENTYAHDTDIKANNTEVCESARSLVDSFVSDINSFINNGKIIKYMEKAE